LDRCFSLTCFASLTPIRGSAVFLEAVIGLHYLISMLTLYLLNRSFASDALGHASLPVCSLCRQFFSFFAGSAHVFEISSDSADVHSTAYITSQAILDSCRFVSAISIFILWWNFLICLTPTCFCCLCYCNWDPKSATTTSVCACACAGKGCVYSFDPVGSYEREVYRAGGSAGAILQPLLDNQVWQE